MKRNFFQKIPEEKVFTKKSSKRNHCQKKCDKILCQWISKETLPAKSLERGISTKKNQNIFGKISLTISLPRTLWRDIYTKQISAVTSTEKVLDESFLPQTPWKGLSTKQSLQNNFQKKPLPKNISGKIYKTHISRKVFTKAMSKDIFTTNYLQINSQKKSLSNKTWKKHIIQTKTLKRKYVPKILEEKSLPKIHCREMCAENRRRVIPVQTRIEGTLLPKNIWRESFYQEIFEEKSLPKNMWQSALQRTSAKLETVKLWKSETVQIKLKFLSKKFGKNQRRSG